MKNLFSSRQNYTSMRLQGKPPQQHLADNCSVSDGKTKNDKNECSHNLMSVTHKASDHHLHHEEQWWDAITQHWLYQLLTVDLEKYAIICSNAYILPTPGSTCAKLGHLKNLGSEGRHLMGIGWLGKKYRGSRKRTYPRARSAITSWFNSGQWETISISHLLYLIHRVHTLCHNSWNSSSSTDFLPLLFQARHLPTLLLCCWASTAESSSGIPGIPTRNIWSPVLWETCDSSAMCTLCVFSIWANSALAMWSARSENAAPRAS